MIDDTIADPSPSAAADFRGMPPALARALSERRTGRANWHRLAGDDLAAAWVQPRTNSTKSAAHVLDAVKRTVKRTAEHTLEHTAEHTLEKASSEHRLGNDPAPK